MAGSGHDEQCWRATDVRSGPLLRRFVLLGVERIFHPVCERRFGGIGTEGMRLGHHHQFAVPIGDLANEQSRVIGIVGLGEQVDRTIGDDFRAIGGVSRLVRFLIGFIPIVFERFAACRSRKRQSGQSKPQPYPLFLHPHPARKSPGHNYTNAGAPMLARP